MASSATRIERRSIDVIPAAERQGTPVNHRARRGRRRRGGHGGIRRVVADILDACES